MNNLNKNFTNNFDLTPVILSGGSGSRLWPLSRATFPKQYLNLEERNSYSLLQNTYLRLKGLNNLQNPIIISNQDQRFIVAEQMRAIGVKPKSIILEPVGKNTAPAIALAAITALQDNKDPILLILSSDHIIEDEENFRKIIQDGLIASLKEQLVTFGIEPNSPNTGYGYIETYDEISEENQHSKIKSFIEKPSLKIARELIKDKHFLWNSGIFLFKASTILKELKKYNPEIIKICEEAINKGSKDLDFFRVNKEIFQQSPDLPIDIAVMEKTKLGTVFSLKVGWNDIGNWKSIWENSKKDDNGNTLKGKVITEDVKNCYLRSEERLLVGIDIQNLVIVETNDAILVSNKDSTQKVKKIVQKLNKCDYQEGNKSNKDYRPWGSFTSIEKQSTWQVKKLEIKPNSSISLQMHNHRSEHWIVVKGTAKVELDEKVLFLNINESIYIPKNSKHRLTNQSDKKLVLIEVQSGKYLGEDDIIRFEDNYGRIPN